MTFSNYNKSKKYLQQQQKVEKIDKQQPINDNDDERRKWKRNTGIITNKKRVKEHDGQEKIHESLGVEKEEKGIEKK